MIIIYHHRDNYNQVMWIDGTTKKDVLRQLALMCRGHKLKRAEWEEE